jgi:hypothetical protein
MEIRRRFWMAMGSYGILAAVAFRQLDGPIRLAVWVFLAGLALKTWIALYRKSS